jgi:outer membrane cobalamin receptor
MVFMMMLRSTSVFVTAAALCRLLFVALLLMQSSLVAQSNAGELRVKVIDPEGLGLRSFIDLVCAANQFHRTYMTDESGFLELKTLAFGLYRIQVTQRNFQTYSNLIEIRSAIPREFEIKLAIAANQTVIEVRDSDTLMDPHRVGTVNRIGTDTIEHASIAMPGRSLIDLVNTQPGWLLESNGALHPRGSENQTQYVVNGVPLTDNRSTAFAPEIEADDIQSMSILTASFPAEYGRKLGGVIEVSTARDVHPGLHAALAASGGSFGIANGSVTTQYGWGKNAVDLSAGGAVSDRYLDPPVLQNFNNHSTSSSFFGQYERDLNLADRLTLAIRHEQATFQIPNDLVQETAGQRQSRGNFETMGIFSYQHIFSPELLADLRIMSRDVSSGLSSNQLSSPIIAGQQRGFREGYLKTNIVAHHGIHELKAGIEINYGSLHEEFADTITDVSQFDPGTPLFFSFSGKGIDREQALYAQDLVRMGLWTLSAGLRWDHYQLVAEGQAVSPRLGIAWNWPHTGITFHVSYDHAFQTPTVENILLASSPEVIALNPQVLRVPVQPSSGNFYEAGLSTVFFNKLRLDANYYRRSFTNFADDDVLLNTGISIPIAFRKAEIYGAESKLEMPRWGRFSSWLSYSYLVGFGYTPITGGVFLGNDATDALNPARFPITQDQRNTITAGLRYQITPRFWLAHSELYGSGLPTEFSGAPEDVVQRFGAQIVDRIDLERGRVRPSLSLNVAAGLELIKKDKVSMRVRGQVQNLNNRINVINFSGLFSGTGIAPPRSYALRVTTSF